MGRGRRGRKAIRGEKRERPTTAPTAAPVRQQHKAMEHGTIVGIHLAILGIGVTSLIGYQIYLSTEVDSAERKVITEASKINGIRHFPFVTMRHEYETLDFRATLEELKSKIAATAEITTDDRQQLDREAQDVADLMGAVTHAYPFRSPFGKKRGFGVPEDGAFEPD